MLKVFLVEDEFVVREGIKNNIDWSEAGFKFCGDASDGELAYPLIQNEQPDIIITDIRMPFMDGLELSRLVKKELPQSKIIILSGHEEFGYAQEAIRIGVAEYLLKPINSTELLKSVKHVGEEIKNERIEMENFDRYKRDTEENEIDTKRKLFNDIVSGSFSTAGILEHGKELGLELSAQYYQIILFKYNITTEYENYSNESSSISKEFYDVNSRFSNIILFDRAIEGVAFLIKGDTPDQIDSLRNLFVNEIKAVMDRHPSFRYFGGIGTCVSRLKLISESFERAACAFSYRFIMDKSTILNCNELPSYKRSEYSDASLEVLELGSIDFKKAEMFLRNGEAEEITFFVEKFLNGIIKNSDKSFLFRQYVVINIYLTVSNFMKELGVTEKLDDNTIKGSEIMNEFNSEAQKLKDYVVRIFTIAIEQRDIIRTKRYHRIIEQAKEYINDHFFDEDLSLNETASFVNISPSHFSAVFSREAGKSFIRYLTDLRMNKAKELLKCSNLRCSDISIAVGYKDPHYFSYLFKKMHNCSPMQYRALKK